MRIFIANIPHQLSEQEINQLLTQYGQVISLKLPTGEDGKRKGFGFAEMRDRAQAQKAIEGLNGVEINGRKISVKEANDNPPAHEQRGKRQRITGEAENPGEIDGNRW